MFELRPYQREAVDKAIHAIRKSTASIVLELATAAGKSIICAEIANRIREMSGKKTLCLAPSKELIVQNYEKYIATGHPATFFSASVGVKSVAMPVVFGTPQSVNNGIDGFKTDFACIIIDECHGITPTIEKIISAMKEGNPNLRVIGLTATPFRTLSGYVYKMDDELNPVPETQAIDPYFDRLVYRIQTQELLDMGFLTKPVFGAGADHYHAIDMKLNNRGQFEASEVKEVFEGRGRLTSQIVADVVQKADPRLGVMFFAASIAHSEEIAESLPSERTAIITGKTHKKERETVIRLFRHGNIRYLINVAVLTTGFDAPNVGTVAILRATESPGLLLQIIGRGMRLHDGKEQCLVLDYAQNLERHGLSQSDLNPDIRARQKKEQQRVDVVCPECGYRNEFSADPVTKGYPLDEGGYVLDSFGERIPKPDGGFITGHRGQRCHNRFLTRNGVEQCSFRFTEKNCVECGHGNSLSARRCAECDAELSDPNKKLVLDSVTRQQEMSNTITAIADRVSANFTKSGAIAVNFHLPRKTVTQFLNPNHSNIHIKRLAYKFFRDLVSDYDTGQYPIDEINNSSLKPKIQYTLRKTGFYSVKILKPDTANKH